MMHTMPKPLVETEWLNAHLADPSLRILDCTVFLKPVEGGVRPESGREEWARGHIPGSAFADLLGDLSARDTSLPVMMPPAEQFAAAMSSYGVGDGTSVVLYDSSQNMWAARVWWMLRAFGFDDAAVLNGGWRKWTLEQRPVSTADPQYPPAKFVARPRAGFIVNKEQVFAAIDDSSVRMINALSADEHAGKVTRTRRPGHIPNSMNVPAGSLVDSATNAYLSPDVLRSRFAQAGALDRERVITYCGGGIAACSDALALTMLGQHNVAVYDGSLAEWASDPNSPLEVGT
jgi:thiosulfate/3-mercaptopyruvate sulfurtransferase